MRIPLEGQRVPIFLDDIVRREDHDGGWSCPWRMPFDILSLIWRKAPLIGSTKPTDTQLPVYELPRSPPQRDGALEESASKLVKW